MKHLLIAMVMVLGFTQIAEAKEVAGINVPSTMNANGASLNLNGAGLREKFFIDVYVGALYLGQKTSDAAKVINSEEPMAIKLHMLRDVDGEKMANANREGFENATGGNTAPIKSEIDSFLAVFGSEASEGNVYDMVYIPGKGLEVYVNNKLTSTIKGAAFKKALFGIWLSDNPAQESLKDDMLGG